MLPETALQVLQHMRPNMDTPKKAAVEPPKSKPAPVKAEPQPKPHH
jgi:hypothetical protein